MVGKRTPGGDDTLSLRNNRPKFKKCRNTACNYGSLKSQLLALSRLSVCLSVCPSICPYGTTRLRLDAFLLNYI
jgi:hypothetical protein